MSGLRDIPSWVGTHGGMLILYHCFWQAAYHAFRAYVTTPEPARAGRSYIRLGVTEFDDGGGVVTVDNLSASMKQPALSTTDELFQARMMQRLVTYQADGSARQLYVIRRSEPFEALDPAAPDGEGYWRAIIRRTTPHPHPRGGTTA